MHTFSRGRQQCLYNLRLSKVVFVQEWHEAVKNRTAQNKRLFVVDHRHQQYDNGWPAYKQKPFLRKRDLQIQWQTPYVMSYICNLSGCIWHIFVWFFCSLIMPISPLDFKIIKEICTCHTEPKHPNVTYYSLPLSNYKTTQTVIHTNRKQNCSVSCSSRERPYNT